MLRYIYGHQLDQFPVLQDSMFRDRADQFHTRLGWEVTVNEDGKEYDQYDSGEALYVIWENADGTHGGSMRFLPTSGPTMINDHFLDLLDGHPIRSDQIFECTRFCLARNSGPRVSAALMLGGAELGLAKELSFSIGVFDARMVRIYSRLGWAPLILGTMGEGRDAISAGLWAFSESRVKTLCEKADIPRGLSRLWYHRAMEKPAVRLVQTA